MAEEVSNTTDISNKTIVVLVILTVIISLLGTMVVLNEVSNIKISSVSSAPKVSKTSSSSNGQVSLSIVEPPQPSHSVGYVTLAILPKK